jgi:glutamate N-acetyltransferase/amino-acid N-acetyltransferase
VSVTAAAGFVASGVAAGIRRRDRKDLAIVRSVPRATGAAMFTRNRVQAACLQVCREHLSLAEPQAVVINSGVANAATGERGVLDALATSAEAGRLMSLDAEEVLVLSTGVIGARLPMHKLLPALDPAAAALSPDGGHDAAEAIMTTDTRPKEAVAARSTSSSTFTLGGMAKGSGMIHPDLATMLAVVTTDYPLEPGEAIEFLRPAVEKSFNAISVDGEPSTNDCVILLANGASGAARDDAAFAAALDEVCADLARQVVADGEGITVLAEIAVTGAADASQAKAIARRIATSPLVKTALFGHDANWGRVLMAAGSAPWNGGYAAVDAEKITLRYNGTVVLDRGTPSDAEPDVSGPSCTIELDLGLGDGSASYLTSDLSYDYVRINADYRT